MKQRGSHGIRASLMAANKVRSVTACIVLYLLLKRGKHQRMYIAKRRQRRSWLITHQYIIVLSARNCGVCTMAIHVHCVPLFMAVIA